MSDQAFRETRRIAMLAYEGCDLLDVCGPLDVFAFANFGLRTSEKPMRR